MWATSKVFYRNKLRWLSNRKKSSALWMRMMKTLKIPQYAYLTWSNTNIKENSATRYIQHALLYLDSIPHLVSQLSSSLWMLKWKESALLDISAMKVSSYWVELTTLRWKSNRDKSMSKMILGFTSFTSVLFRIWKIWKMKCSKSDHTTSANMSFWLTLSVRKLARLPTGSAYSKTYWIKN